MQSGARGNHLVRRPVITRPHAEHQPRYEDCGGGTEYRSARKSGEQFQFKLASEFERERGLRSHSPAALLHSLPRVVERRDYSLCDVSKSQPRILTLPDDAQLSAKTPLRSSSCAQHGLKTNRVGHFSHFPKSPSRCDEQSITTEFEGGQKFLAKGKRHV